MNNGWRRLCRACIAAIAVSAGAASAQPHSDHDLEAEKARVDSLNRAVLWHDVVALNAAARVADVAFAAVGRNIVTPIEIAWTLADSLPELVAVAARPIAGTADAGEELGRRGGGLLRDPIALHTTIAGSWILERQGRLVSLRGTQVDSVQLDLQNRTPRDLAVGDAGLVHVLTDRDVRVWSQSAQGPPLWTMELPAALLPAVAVAVSARGEIFVAGAGKTAVAVFDLGARGRYTMVRSCTAAQAGIGAAGGITLLEAMLLPVTGREGWVAEDRFVTVSDRSRGALVVLDAATLARVGRVDLRGDLDAVQPGRLDVNNRGQVALVDAARGMAWALPTRVLATAMETSTIRWRQIGSSADAAGDSTRTGP